MTENTARGSGTTVLERPAGVMGLLAAGVPLTLLLDLAPAHGPDSRSILEDERAEITWLRLA